MQVSVEQTGTLGRKMTVEVPAERIDTQVEQRIRELGKRARIKGFRPGRVPYKVLRQRYGSQVHQEVISEVLRETFQQALSQESLQPAGTPEIDATPRDDGEVFQYTATFEVLPEIGEIDVSELDIERPVAEVEESNIDDMIRTLQQQRRDWTEVERPAGEGDLVVFEYVAEAGDERYPAEGRERVGAVLGSGNFFAEAERQLEGLSAGDERSLEVTFPEDFREPSIAGRAGTMQVTVTSVSEGELPEVDEEFIRGFGVESGDLEDFRQDVRRNLERELEDTIRNRLRQQVLDKLLEAYSSLELPDTLIDDETERLQQQAKQQIGQDIPAEDLRGRAHQRVMASLLLNEIARQQSIQADAARVRQAIERVAATYEQPEQILQLYYENQRLLGDMQNRVLEDQVIDWVLDHARVTDVPKTFDELLRPDLTE